MSNCFDSLLHLGPQSWLKCVNKLLICWCDHAVMDSKRRGGNTLVIQRLGKKKSLVQSKILLYVRHHLYCYLYISSPYLFYTERLREQSRRGEKKSIMTAKKTVALFWWSSCYQFLHFAFEAGKPKSSDLKTIVILIHGKKKAKQKISV